MKRMVLLTLTTCLALAALVVCWQTGTADEKKETPRILLSTPVRQAMCQADCCEVVPTSPPASRATAVDAQVQELITIMNETKSPYTLVATTVALIPLGDKAKVAVPVILRNAERLKILENLGNPDSKKGEVATMLLETIYAIQAGWSMENGSPFQSRWQQPRVMVPPPPPPMYGPAQQPFYAPPVCPPATKSCPAQVPNYVD